jgi:hypothetical protein
MPKTNQTKQTSKQIAQLDQENTLIVMQELQTNRNNELATTKQHAEIIFNSTIEELKKLQIQRFEELSKIVDDTCMESKALVKALTELKQHEKLIEFLEAKNYTNNYLEQTLISADRQQESMVSTVINMAKNRKDELTDLMFSIKQKQEDALLELLKIKIKSGDESNQTDNVGEDLELIVKRSKLEYKNTLLTVQETQKQLTEELKHLKKQAEESQVATLATMTSEQNDLKQKMDEIKQQNNTMLYFTKYKALLANTKNPTLESNEAQPSNALRLTC